MGFVDARIVTGLRRLEGFQHEDGRFSIWCGGTPGLDITARVAHRLSAFKGLPYISAERMLENAANALLATNYRDNQLLHLNPRFRDKMVTTKDAVAIYFYGDNQPSSRSWLDRALRRDEGAQEALDFLRRTAQRANGHVRWVGKAEWGHWGGDLEATCDAARVMADAGDALFVPAFNYVGSNVIAGGLYSTADTRALVELFAFLRKEDEPLALVDGVETRPTEATIGREVTALRDHVLVRVDEEIIIDHLAPRDNFSFRVNVEPKEARLGERIRIKIRLGEDSLCPLARVYLPPCLALLKGGANVQTAHLPIGVDGLRVWRDTRGLELDTVAVREGQGELRVAVHDLYDAGKIGTVSGPRITVGRR